MNWKKTIFYFYYQLFKFSRNSSEFSKNKSYFKFWRNSFAVGRSSVADEKPWICYPAFEYLDEILTKKDKIFEYGGGGSTLYFLKKIGEVHTVEHHKEWFGILENMVKEKGYQTWKGNFIEPEKRENTNNQFDYRNTDHFQSRDKNFVHHTFENYVTAIDKYADEYFDLVLVDGRARVSCVKHAINKVKKGGFLVVDNAERTYYTEPFSAVFKEKFEVVMDEMAPLPYTPDFDKTLILRKL